MRSGGTVYCYIQIVSKKILIMYIFHMGWKFNFPLALESFTKHYTKGKYL